MPRIFISYRRDDSAGYAGRLSDGLEARYGAGNVFRDIDDIRPGEDFLQALQRALVDCDVVIPVIGPRWLNSGDTGVRRIDMPDDTLRLELRSALSANIRVIPALVDGARMPDGKALPHDIAELARRQAVVLSDRTWDADVDALCREIGSGDAEVAQQSASASPEGSAASARRRGLRLGLLGVAALGLGMLASRQLGRPPDLSGEWQLENGSVWYVQQAGNTLKIDEMHYETREIWRSGTATLRTRDLDMRMTYMFQPGVTLDGTLRLSDDARSMSGTVTEHPSERSFGLAVRR